MLNHIDLMAALTADYLNVFVLRPKEDSADIIKLKGYVTRGITDNPQGFSYSKLLETYANDRVYTGDRDYFLKKLSTNSLLEFFNENNTLEYDYRIIENNEIHYYTARYNRISNPDEDLRLVVAFRNIDSIVSIGQEQHAKGLYNAYNALSGIFFSLHRVDVQNNTYTTIKTMPSIERATIPNSNDYDANAQCIIRALSSKQSCSEALSFVDRSTLEERMAGKGHIMMDFISYAAEACRLHFFKEDDDENGKLSHVIFDVEKVDEQESNAIISALSREYQNVYLINLEDGTSRTIKTNNLVSEDLNEKQDQIFHYDQISEKYISSFIHPDDREMTKENLSLEHLREAFRTKDEITGSFRSLINGETHYYRYTFYKLTNLNSVIADLRNIDDIIAQHAAEEQRQHEQELAYQKQREEQLAIFDSLAHNFKNVYLADIKNGTARVLKLEDDYSDHRLDNVMNIEFPYEPFLNAWISEAVHPEDKQMLSQNLSVAHLRQVFETQEEYVGNYRMLIKGTVINYQFRVTLMQDKAHLIAGFQNIDAIIKAHLEEEKKRQKKEQAYQAQLKEHQRQLSQALLVAQQANKAKSTFLNSMSHDIRTPMNAIIGFTALAQTHMDNPALVQDYLAKISTSSSHLLNLINDILDMSRIESGTVKLDEKPLHLPDLLRDLRTMVQGLINAKNQNLFIETQNLVHEDVIADRLRLNQVMINIVGNAIKYTQPDGDIKIKLLEKHCSIKNYTTFEFSVKDNGIGMSKSFLEHVFESFSREHSSTVTGIQGTGLGMAITKSIVNMMGGTITAESEQGKGSLFTVTLNLKPATAKENKVATKVKHYNFSGKHALLAEDNELNREIATAILEDIGFKVDSVADGTEAVDAMYKAAEDEYDLIFMDIQMPKMDGYTATHEIRTLANNKKANIPIVAMTANAFEEDRKKSLEAGMDGHIAKPISMEEIAKVLDSIFEAH